MRKDYRRSAIGNHIRKNITRMNQTPIEQSALVTLSRCRPTTVVKSNLVQDIKRLCEALLRSSAFEMEAEALIEPIA
jgi:hypothetical protein